MNIIGRRRIWYAFSGLVLGLSILALAVWGLKLGVDFRGGSLMEVAIANTSVEAISHAVQPAGVGNLVIQPTDRGTFILRMETIDETKHQDILNRLGSLGPAEEKNFTTVGPTIGSELKRRSGLAVALTSLAIILYLAISFRRVPQPMTSWRFGVVAVLALLHDVTITVGAFAILGHFFGGFEVDTLLVVAALTVMGFSVHDTIVVFDRLRENLRLRAGEPVESVINDSVIETVARSLNTSLTVFLVLLSLYLLGGESTRNFVLALLIGIGFGTYSSIFIAAPLVVSWQNFVARRRKA